MPINISKSAKLYQERRIYEDAKTVPTGAMRHSAKNSPVHSMTLSPPLPLREVVVQNTDHLPDGGATELWPHGEFTIM